MSRDVPFNPNAKCDTCGRIGAYDFMGDYICTKCSKIPKEDPIPSLPEGPADGVTQTGWQEITEEQKDGELYLVWPQCVTAWWDMGADDWIFTVIPLNDDFTISHDWTKRSQNQLSMEAQFRLCFGHQPTHWSSIPPPPQDKTL